MLLIGGKNLVPLVSAAVIQSLGWRWVFIIVGIIVAVMFVLTYLCVPETCWDRTPLTSDLLRRQESRSSHPRKSVNAEGSSSPSMDEKEFASNSDTLSDAISGSHVRFTPTEKRPPLATHKFSDSVEARRSKSEPISTIAGHGHSYGVSDSPMVSPTSHRSESRVSFARPRSSHSLRRLERQEYAFQVPPQDVEPIPSNASQYSARSVHEDTTAGQEVEYRFRKKTYKEMLVIYQGRLSREKWWKAALRPFILFAYPAIAFVRPQPITLIIGYLTIFIECGVAYRAFRSCCANIPGKVFTLFLRCLI